MLIGKIDLLPHLEVDLAAFGDNLARVHPGVQTLQVSARTGEGLDDWCDWISHRVARRSWTPTQPGN